MLSMPRLIGALCASALCVSLAHGAFAQTAPPGSPPTSPAAAPTRSAGIPDPSAPVVSTLATQTLDVGSQKVRVVPVAQMQFPSAFAFLPNGDALVTQKASSSLRLIHNGVLDPKLITGLPPMLQAGGLRAGVDIAIHPKFAQNHLVYFTYQRTMPGRPDVAAPALARARYDGGYVLKDVRDLLVTDAWSDGQSASRLAFGADGKVYMTIGTALLSAATSAGRPGGYGDPADAQDGKKLAGKVLRVNDDGSVPKDNPFVGNSAYRPEIYALGVRNPLGIALDAQTGTLYATDMGPRGGDEINIIKAGLNYGWPKLSYGRAYIGDPDGKRSGMGLPPNVQPPSQGPGFEGPLLFWVPSPAPAGIVLYRGDKFGGWKNSLFVTMLAGQRIERISFSPQGWESARQPMLNELKARIRDIKEGPDGLIYFSTDMKDGAVWRIEPAN